jgi:hypothetical protein
MKTTELNGKAVQLHGRKQDLKSLSEHFCFRDFCIYGVSSASLNAQTNKEEEYDEYYLKSPSFDSKTDDREINSEAVDIVALINGEAQLEVAIYTIVGGRPPKGLPDFLPVQASANTVSEFKNGARAGVNILASAITGRLIPSDFRKLCEAQGLEVPEDLKKRDDVKALELVAKQEKVIESHFPLLELVKSDENVREALSYYGYQHSWSNLFRAWEVIKKDMGYRSSKGWKNSSFGASLRGTRINGNENRFSQTANYHRHGGPGREKELPNAPMLLDEAELFMQVLMLYWLNWKRDNPKIQLVT